MDARNFDRITKILASDMSRRHTLATLLGGALGLLTLVHPQAADAATSNKCKPQCGACQYCQKGTCKKKHGKKTCKPGKCKNLPSGSACSGGTCQGGACIPSAPTCADGIKNGSETDIDCGGSCPRCANGRTCSTRSDCASARCAGGTCQTCSSNPDCGAGCSCYESATTGTNFCVNPAGLGEVSMCTLCPAGTVCVNLVVGDFNCYPLCATV